MLVETIVRINGRRLTRVGKELWQRQCFLVEQTTLRINLPSKCCAAAGAALEIIFCVY